MKARSQIGRAAGSFLLAAALVAACASKGQVLEQTRHAEERLERVEVVTAETNLSVAEAERAAARSAALLAESEEELDGAAALAHLALTRAREAEVLARGRLAGEVVYVIDDLRFAPGSTTLTPESRSILDQLAERLLLEDAGYYLELQGHADAAGSAQANLLTGGERAQAVRLYLHARGIPLHRIGAVSLGSSAPAADNRTFEGRSENRRVVVVVLR